MKKSTIKLATMVAPVLIMLSITVGCGEAENQGAQTTGTTNTEATKGSNDKALEEFSQLINKNTPVKIDEITTLVNSTVTSPNTLQYEFRIADIKKADLDETKMPEIIEGERIKLVENAKTNGEMAALREMNTDLIYVYKDADGNELYKVNIKGDEY